MKTFELTLSGGGTIQVEAETVTHAEQCANGRKVLCVIDLAEFEANLKQPTKENDHDNERKAS